MSRHRHVTLRDITLHVTLPLPTVRERTGIKPHHSSIRFPLPVAPGWFIRRVSTLVAIVITCISCSGSSQTLDGPGPATVAPEPTGIYRNHANSQVVSDQIRDSFQSIKRVQATLYYRTYHFDENNLPDRSQLSPHSIEDLAVEVSTDNHSVTGTALAVTRTRSSFLMLTAAHIVTAPDTIWHYPDPSGPLESRAVEAVSVNVRSTYLMIGSDFVLPFTVISKDEQRDLALLAVPLNETPPSRLQPLEIVPGNSDELAWGDMVYTIGFPKGNRMITTGVISRPEWTPGNRFIIDSSFNRGFSGGVVLAVRSRPAGLEWVGMLVSVSAESEYLLTPGSMTADEFQPEIPYNDPAYVERFIRINYGIGYMVGIQEIVSFFRENRDEILLAGFLPPM